MPSSLVLSKRFPLPSSSSWVRRSLFAVALSIGAAIAPSTASGQITDQAVPGHAIKHWTTADGLPHNWISAIVQAADGYLWIGTNNAGLVRFDGLAFKTFNVLNTPALPSDAVTAIHQARDGTLWIGTVGGLVRYREGVFAAERLEDVASTPSISDIRSGRDGRVWVAAEREVLRRDADRWTVVLRQAGVQRVWPSDDGTTWIATHTALIEWRGDIVRTFAARDGVPGGNVLALREDRRGRVWVGTTEGLAYLDRAHESAALHRTVLPDARISALYEDGAGTLWIGGRNRIFTLTADGELSESMLESYEGAVAVIDEDREGHLWIGAEGWRGGLYRLTRARVSMVGQRELPCDNTGAITQAVDGTIWLSTFCDDGDGVFAIRGGKITRYPGPSFVTSLLAEPDGTVWAGTTDGGIHRFDGRRFEEIETPTRAQDNAVLALHRDSRGALWLGTTAHGLFRWQDGRWTRLQASDGLASNDVRSILGDRDGSIWIGMAGGISRYRDGDLITYRVADGAPPGPVRTMHVDADGTLWLGAYGGGLARLKDGVWTRYGVQGGLLDSSVHRILDDGNGFLWLTGDRGIRRVSKHDLNAIADGAAASLDVSVLTEADGMRSIECNGMAQPAGWRLRDGRLYFPTQGGVASIDPVALSPERPVPLHVRVEDVLADGRSIAAAGGAEATVAPGYRDVEIRYAAPSFAKPELIQFRYRLEGNSSDWVEVGIRRTAAFGNLSPGRYRFHVSARNGSDWSEPAVLTLVLQPFFYQRTSFQIALGVLVALLGGVASRWYVSRLRHRAAALERAVAERTAELSVAHDRLSTAHGRLSLANEDLVKAKHEVEQAHGQLLAVFDQLDIGVLVLSPNGVVRYASASAQRVLRKDEYALVGQTWSACLPLLDGDRVQVRERVERRAGAPGRAPVQMLIGGTRYWMEIDVRDEPAPGDGCMLYMYDVAELSAQPGSDRDPHGLIGRSTVMRLVHDQIRDVARVDSTVLIQGETGTGKELVARAIHRESRRASRPFIAVNAAGLSESLLASQLFGHRRGAFTGAVDDQIGVFEAANGGTLFLDEVGDMPPNVQISLLRVLQEREVVRLGESHPRRVDVRFLAATHRDLAREVAAGRFREDLLYRIRVTTLVVPPLRDRIDDVPLLVNTFLLQAVRDGRYIPQVSRPAMEALMRYRWPGNVRELKSMVERALVHAKDDVIHLDDLPQEVVTDHWTPIEVDRMPAGASERERLIAALRQTGGNRKEAARLLGIGRTTLYRRLAEYGIETADPS